MKTLRLFVLAIGFVAFYTSAYAQQDGQFSLYMQNPLYFNPAYAGTDVMNGEATLVHRSSWLGYESSFDDGGSPSTQMFSVLTPIKIGNRKVSYGVGMYVLNETFANTTIQDVQLSFSWVRRMNNNARLSVGARAGLYGKGLDFDQYRPVDPDDPLINRTGIIRQFSPDVSLGVYYKHDDYFFAVSANHLSEPAFDDFGLDALPLKRHFNAMAGFKMHFNKKSEMLISGIVKSDLVTSSFEVSGLWNFDKRYYLGLSYREQDAFILLAGYSLSNDKRLRLFYALDFVTPATRDAKSWTSHEVVLRYRFKGISIKLPSKEHSTRYRLE